jgi:hypothetical protein
LSSLDGRRWAEVEAESVAYLVTYTHGLDSGAYTFPMSPAGPVRWTPSPRSCAPPVSGFSGPPGLVLAATEHLGTGAAESSVLDDDVARDLQNRAEHGAQRTSAD